MKWFLLNARRRILFAARNPGYAFRSLLREALAADERFMARAIGGKAAEIRHFLDEPRRDLNFLQHLKNCEGELEKTQFASADLYAKRVLIQYAVVRAIRPDTIVETGVANGVSTSYLLLALRKNQTGTLHSVEIGDATYLPPGRDPGWMVPDWLCAHWQLHLGDASAVLPTLLEQLGLIDLFVHDSLHTYEHMMFEFERAFPHLRPGGVLLADDALWNPAFGDFAAKVHAPVAEIVRGIGILRK